MNATIGKATLTTEHPASSHNQPVMVLDGRVYGPEDMLGDNPAGAAMTCSDAVCGVGGRQMDQPAVAALCQWLRQSPANGMRWIEDVRRAQTAGVAEFADEQ